MRTGSDRHEELWRSGWTITALLVAVASLVLWPPTAVVLVTAGGSVVGASVFAAALPDLDVTDQLHPRERWSLVLRRGAAIGVSLEALLALVTLSAGLAFLTVVAAAITSPWVLPRLTPSAPAAAARDRARLVEPIEQLVRGASEPATIEVLALDRARTAVGQLDLDGLCWAWRRSYEALTDVHDPEGFLGLVTLRQLYLDEMERRHPAGFAQWLASGARAASTPERFLQGPAADAA